MRGLAMTYTFFFPARMTNESFDNLLSHVHEHLVHAPTHRTPISPAERLAITLR